MAVVASSPQLLKSVSLALRVLEELADAGSDQGVSELARRLGVSKATVYRVLTTLEHRGFVRQDGATSRYAVGPTLRKLAYQALADLDLPRDAQPFLNDLRDGTGHTVHLAILDGAEAVYVARAPGDRPVQVASAIGTRCPAHCVSTGKVLLAHAGPEAVETVVAAGLEPFTPKSRLEREDLLRDLQQVRETGYWINWGEWRLEVRGVAGPVRDATGEVVAAVGVCGPASVLTRTEFDVLTPLVLETAERVSGHLGHQPVGGDRGSAEQPTAPSGPADGQGSGR